MYGAERRWGAILREIHWLALCCLAIATLAPTAAYASPGEAERADTGEAASPVTAPLTELKLDRSSAWPYVATLVPGLLLHGSGHWAAGQRDTGYRLLAAEGLGVGVVAAGGVTLFATGAARQLVGPAAVALGLGTGLFITSWLADVWGVLAPPHLRGAPQYRLPHVELELGPRFIYDPRFDYGTFVGGRAHLRWGGWRVSPQADVAATANNQRLRLEAARRFWGPGARPRALAQDGSYLDAVTALTHHRFGNDGFSATTAEAFALGRLDLQRLDPVLRGSFTEWGVGAAFRVTHYDLPTATLGDDGETLLLMRLAFGIYLGDGDGEAMLYYDHRHDNFAAGMIMPGLISGVIGHAGISGFYYFAERWGLGVDLQRGAAYVASITARYRLPVGGP